nr:uncharacterized protein LOC128669702 [Plodia interpunctella]
MPQSGSPLTNDERLCEDLFVKTTIRMADGLNLFLDDRKVIRFGGRLSNSSDFNYDKKHPVLLCNKHYFTLLLVGYEHRRLLHAGPQLLLSSLRECWWPLSARNLVKKIVHPYDFNPLTPGHFLIGRPLTAPASTDDVAAATSTTPALNRYRRIEQIRLHFWQRWSKEYIAELQTRTKWKTNKNDIAMDSMVLIKDDNQPPLKWKLGRIVKTYPGADGVSRVADIRTATGIIRRSFSKICPLPLQPES